MIAVLALSLCGLPSGAAAAGCPNEQFRTGLSASLPDCRAYELVSPANADGRLLGPLPSLHFADMFATDLVSVAGDSVLFAAVNSPLVQPPEPNGSVDMYQAVRSSAGWETVRRLSVPGPQGVLPDPGGVSVDHGYMFAHVAPFLGSSGGALAGKSGSDYLSKPDGSFELTGFGSLGAEPLAQGRFISAHGEHVVFSTGKGLAESLWCEGVAECEAKQLESDAPPTGTGAVYDREIGGPTHVVSLLPGNVTPAAGEGAEYQGASPDGSVIAFKVGSVLYVRVDNAKTEEVTNAVAAFAGISTGGEKLFYVNIASGEEGDIEEFDVTSEATSQINSSGDARVVNVSADGSHVYFISPSQLDGVKGVVGQPNLYVWTAATGNVEYVATVASSDLEHTSGELPNRPALTNWTGWVTNPEQGANMGPGPGADSSRTTPDGRFLLFESRAKLTTYENSGHTEVYRYDAAARSLACVSCNPSGAPAVADARLENSRSISPPVVIENLSEDGSRAFFETSEALVSQDTDGGNDVYEWREGTAGGAPTVALISSGTSTVYPALAGHEESSLPQQNMIVAVSPGGRDVIFSASEQLLPEAGAGGTQAIYDARVDGGFPQAAVPQACREEECRSAAGSAPSLLTPRSEGLANGNVRTARCHRRHRRKKHRRHHHRKRHPDRPSAGRRGRTRRSSCVRHRHRKQPSRHRGGVPKYDSIAAPEAANEQASAADATSAPGAASLSSPAASTPAGPAGSAIQLDSSGDGSEEFGIESVGAALSTSAAGARPDFTVRFVLNHQVNKEGRPVAAARMQNVSVSLPPGLVGNVTAFPRCSGGSFAAFANCPIDSQVGIAKVQLTGNLAGEEVTLPVYNLEPAHRQSEIARLGLFPAVTPVYIGVKVRTGSDYGVTATIEGAPAQDAIISTAATLWGDPPDPSHDEQRLTTAEGIECQTACKAPEGRRSSGLPPTSFMTNPSACQEGAVGFRVSSYQLPGREFDAQAQLPAIGGCQGLPFAPSLEVEPTSRVAGAPTGLLAKLRIPQHEGPDERATSTLRDAEVTLPQGMTLASGAADGLAACSAEQVHYQEEVPAECPDASKLGTATFVSPDLNTPLHGAIYQRAPEGEHLFRIWLVSDELGLHVKLAGEVHPDPATGQLTTEFTDLPQLPVEEVALEFWGGPRAPLKNPDSCGTYQTSFAFTPWSGGSPAVGQAPLTIDGGCGASGFAPRLKAGVTEPVAGRFSPFVLQLTREDREPNVSGLEVKLPKGELAKLAGVPLCPDAQAAAGACPAGSRIGSVTVAAGPGPQPLWIPQPGKDPTAVYLAGPYEGAPYSIVTVVPAQAGPFDLGTVIVRAGLYVDPESAQVTVRTDPLPQFLKGVPVLYRAIHVSVDRPGFSLNPTDCAPLAVRAQVTAVDGAVAEPSDGFGVGDCRALRFSPKLSLRLRGGTKRGANPALTAVLRARAGQANIGRVAVAMPHSEFLAQAHIDTVCTRVQFAARHCPKGSIYGWAKAWTPLLSEPLVGPVYLRSSSQGLPNLVVALRGPLEIDLVGTIDSWHGGIRTTFDSVPDAPVTKFVLHMRGGKKGLLENSQDDCRGPHRATVRISAQNGRRRFSHPRMRVTCRKG